MAYYLTIDIGNSSAKAALWLDNQPLGDTIQGKLAPIDIEHLCAMAQGPISCAAICAVGADEHGIIDAAQRLSHDSIVVNADTPAPIDTSCYATTLGGDRLAALAGARVVYPDSSVLVVDCGTAITYDLLLADGTFAGGNIAPGIGLRLRALSTFTLKLPAITSQMPQRLWAQDTADAMRAGAFFGVVAETEFYLSQAPAGTQLLITGGRGADMMKLITSNATYDPDLVLKGLKNIIDYNESK